MTAVEVIKNEKMCVERNINGCDRLCNKCDLVLPDKEVLNAFDAAIKALEANRWISVDERLPEFRVPVVVLYDTKNALPYQIDWRINDKYGNEAWCFTDGMQITHWRQLPPRPKA